MNIRRCDTKDNKRFKAKNHPRRVPAPLLGWSENTPFQKNQQKGKATSHKRESNHTTINQRTTPPTNLPSPSKHHTKGKATSHNNRPTYHTSTPSKTKLGSVIQEELQWPAGTLLRWCKGTTYQTKMKLHNNQPTQLTKLHQILTQQIPNSSI